MRICLSTIAFFVTLMIGQAVAEDATTATNPALHSIRQPYDVETFGAFRMLILAGDFSPKVTLAETLTKRPTVGMGALADARGEITIYDGRLIVSYGKEGVHPKPTEESAALLSISPVTNWQAITVDHDVVPGDIENFISATAAAHGLDPEGPFPFKVQGTLMSFVMHVNAAPTNGPHGMGQPIALTVESKGNMIAGSVAGIYASRDLVGIVSHGGTRTHSHWISGSRRMAHRLRIWTVGV